MGKFNAEHISRSTRKQHIDDSDSRNQLVSIDSNLYIIETFYHSFCAQNIISSKNANGQELTETDVQSLNESDVYDWPYDLPLPSLIFFLVVSTDERLSRTDELIDETDTKQIQEITKKDGKLTLIHSLVRGPTSVGLDAVTSKDTLFSSAVDALNYYGVELRARNDNDINSNQNVLDTPEMKSVSSKTASPVPEATSLATKITNHTPTFDITSPSIGIQNSQEDAQVSNYLKENYKNNNINNVHCDDIKKNEDVAGAIDSNNESFFGDSLYYLDNKDEECQNDHHKFPGRTRVSMGVYGMFSKI